MAFISNWFHEGELNVIARYRHPWTALMSWGAAIALSPVLFFGPLSDRILVASVIVLLVGFGILGWQRRVAILTPTTLLFRPMFGKPLEVPLGGIKRLSRWEQPSEGGWVEVCRLEFVVGGFFDVPSGYSGDLAGDVERLIASPSQSN